MEARPQPVMPTSRGSEGMPPSLCSADQNMKAIAVIVGVICGAFVGSMLGFWFAIGLSLWAENSQPENPDAGNIAFVVLLTAPLGAIAGAIFGGVTRAYRPWLYRTTVLPIATVFLCLLMMLGLKVFQ